MDDLIERLDNGVHCIGLDSDNNIELFDIETANETMADAKEALETQAAEITRLREALDKYAKQYCEGEGDWCGMLSEVECGGCAARQILQGDSQ